MTDSTPMSDPRVILLIEDNVSQARLLAQVLRQQGHAVNLAHSVDEALTSLVTAPPVMVILDWHLDRASGALRQALLTMGLPVIVLTGDVNIFDEVKKNGWLCLLKGCDAEDILKAVSALMAAPTSRSGVPTLAHPAETRDSVPPVGLARTDATVAVAHYRWRTIRAAGRLVATLCMTGITIGFSIKGIEPPIWPMALIATVAIGWGAAFDTLRKNPRGVFGIFGVLMGLFLFSVIVQTHALTTVAVALGSVVPAVQFFLERRTS
jgi:ActR/RegA family two-component response regulator